MKHQMARQIAAPAPFDLWLVDLTVTPSAEALDALSASERARADRFAFSRQRSRYLAARCGLRQLLSARTGVDSGSLRLREGPSGKPYLDGQPACAFSLSHSCDVALVALADDGEIGVDVEVLRPFADVLSLAEHHYTAAERAVLAGHAGREQDLAFLFGWTRKEACFKAIGSDLSIGPGSFEVGLLPDLRTVVIDTSDGALRTEVQSFCHDSCLVVSLARLVR